METTGDDRTAASTRVILTRCPDCGDVYAAGLFHGVCPRCAARELLKEDPVSGDAPRARLLAEESVPQLDEFEPMEELGRGGSSVVYRAYQPRLDREVAIKVLSGGLSASRTARSRFLLEAQAVANLDHPNIVPIFGFGEAQGHLYYIMRFFQGGTLAQRAAASAGPSLRPERVAVMMSRIARAVQHAHDRGILHRDLKPANVLLDIADEPYVADFGLARWQAADHRLTVSGSPLGTPAYASPEQVAGDREVTTATDVWGLGGILYELLSGRPPFEGRSLPSLLNAIAEQDPTPPLSVAHQDGGPRGRLSDLERDLQTICLACLRKEPAARYASAAAVADDLDRCVEDRPIWARPVSPSECAWRWCRRHRALAGSALLMLLTLLVLAIAGPSAAIRIARSRDEAQEERVRAQRTVDRLETAAILSRLEENDGGSALALLARRLQNDPRSVADADRVLSILTRHPFGVPDALPSLPLAGRTCTVGWQGRHLVALDAPSGVVEFWDVARRLRTWNGASSCAILDVAENPETQGWALLYENGVIEMRGFSDGHLIAKAHSGMPGSTLLCFGHRARWLAQGGYVSSAALWDVNTMTQIAVLPHDPLSLDPINKDTRVLGLEFSEDDTRIATGGSDGWVHIWSVPDARRLASFSHGSPVFELALCRDGNSVAITGGGLIRICDVAELRQTAELDLLGEEVQSIAFTSDGQSVLYATEAGQFGRWFHRTSPPRRTVLRFTGGSGIIEAGNGTGNVVVNSQSGGGLWWVLSEDRVVAAQIPATAPGTAPDVPLYASEDGRRALIQEADGDVVSWQIPVSHGGPRRIMHTAEVYSASFSPEGDRLASVAWDGEVAIWEVSPESVEPGPRIKHGAHAWQARFSPDGNHLATTGWDEFIKLWDIRSGELVKTLRRQGGGAWWIEFVGKTGRLLTAGAGAGADSAYGSFAAVEAWDLHGSGVPTFAVGTNEFVWSPTLSPDGVRWVVPDASQQPRNMEAATPKLAIIDTKTGRVVLPPLAMPPRRVHGADMIRSTDYSANGRWIAAGAVDRAAIWNAATGELQWEFTHPDRIRAVRFHPDGRRFLTAGEDATARLWDLATGQPLAGVAIMRHALGTSTPLIEGMGIKSACFSPDGRWIATGAADLTARLWDARTGLPLSRPLTHDGPVLHVVFSPDGRWLVTTSADHNARLWRIHAATEPIPTWLPSLLEVLARRRLNEDDQFEPVPREALDPVRRRARAEPPVGVWGEILTPYVGAGPKTF